MIFKIASFLGPFLLFFLEILAPQILLPKFGGSHYVFITALVFFTGSLFFANLVFHFLSIRLKTFNLINGIIFLGFLSPLFLRLDFHTTWDISPYGRVLLYLMITFGPLFFCLSLINPALQYLLSRTGQHTDEDIYHLYSLGNIGSLVGLFIGPLFFDIFFSLNLKLYILIGLFYLSLIILFFINQRTNLNSKNNSKLIIFKDSSNWILFSAVATLFMISTTHFLTTQYGNIPFIWTLPLAIFLLCFIMVFKKGSFLASPLLLFVGIFFILLLELISFGALIQHLILLFLLCHYSISLLYKIKPAQKSLTTFYLSISLGGFLASLLVVILIPNIFYNISSNILEYLFSALVFLLALIYFKRPKLLWSLPIFITLFYFGAKTSLKEKGTTYESRSFYGLTKIKINKNQKEFYHNNTIHGMELLDEDIKKPYVYYFKDSPIGDFFKHAPLLKNIANIGLGIGSLQYYSKEDQHWDLFEIDPQVLRLAKSHFHFLKQSKSKYKIHIGDGRIKIQDQVGKSYDLIIVDVFNGPQIPIHILTKEAFITLKNRLSSDGILAIHTSNSIYDFIPLLEKTMTSLGLSYFSKEKLDIKIADSQRQYPNSWFFAGKNKEIVRELAFKLKAKNNFNRLSKKDIKAWSDQYFNIFSILKI